ncbi:MAG: phage endonuclease [Frankiales bacterium]|nr:phage endonuclease [Frankiales bacterium]
MVGLQGGVCALCRERAPQHVDHDHMTGQVRGVLCSCCNQGLGNFRDRADVLRTAIDYLERTTWQRQQVSPGVYRVTSPRQAAARSRSSSELQHLISSRRG